MSEAIIAIAVVAAAVYLLRPLFRTRGGWRFLLVVLLAALPAGPVRAQTGEPEASIGLLLIAVDVQRDHLRISEALRVVNTSSHPEVDLVITLPPGAAYPTYHRGLRAPVTIPGGFRDRLPPARGVQEVIYSYALPAGRAETIARTFPLRVRRLEIVVRGRGVELGASRGRALEALIVGRDSLPRWEIRDVAAGDAIAFTLRGLPASRPWLPAAGAGSFAVLLAAGLVAAVRDRSRPPEC
jgi:hypothetical protein